jgi:glycosyltransferase involved in cell wall biosynthesis
MNPKVLICILHCDRKAHNQKVCLESVYNQDYDNYEVYHNVETVEKNNFKDLIEYSKNQKINTHFDFWSYESSWWKKPTFDQDQARLVPICEGRNRSIEIALELRFDYLLFVDTDMIIPSNSISGLLSRQKDMIGGYVKGRNDHKHAEYIFGSQYGIKDLGNGLIECDHGNIGFCLISKKVFEHLKFRRGSHPTMPGHLQSDDPNYCFDWFLIWKGERHFIDKNIHAQHIDETVIPFNDGAQY